MENRVYSLLRIRSVMRGFLVLVRKFFDLIVAGGLGQQIPEVVDPD